MPPSRDEAYLWDMLQAARKSVQFTPGLTYDSFRANDHLCAAVERQLIVLGEAARHVSDELRQTHPTIPWREMIGLRNVLVHDYGEVLPEMVWSIVRDDLPVLVIQLERLAPDIEDEADY